MGLVVVRRVELVELLLAGGIPKDNGNLVPIGFLPHVVVNRHGVRREPVRDVTFEKEALDELGLASCSVPEQDDFQGVAFHHLGALMCV